MATITGGTADGRIQKASNVNWATCVASAGTAYTTDTLAFVPQRYWDGSWFYLVRPYFCFDVSPYAGQTVTAATLKLYVANAGTGTTAFTVYYKDWGTSLTTADWTSDVGTLTAASASVPSLSVGNNNITLINLSNVLTSNGRFELALNSEAQPGENNTPGRVCFADNATEAYRPVLELTLAAGKPTHFCHYAALRR